MNFSSPQVLGYRVHEHVPHGEYMALGPFNMQRIRDRANYKAYVAIMQAEHGAGAVIELPTLDDKKPHRYVATDFNDPQVFMRAHSLLDMIVRDEQPLDDDILYVALDELMHEFWQNLSLAERVFWLDEAKVPNWAELVSFPKLPENPDLQEVIEAHVRDACC